jgi:hypothetical protein
MRMLTKSCQTGGAGVQLVGGLEGPLDLFVLAGTSEVSGALFTEPFANPVLSDSSDSRTPGSQCATAVIGFELQTLASRHQYLSGLLNHRHGWLRN